jgi:hypothetical protein
MPSTDVDDSDAVDAQKRKESVGLLHEMLRSFTTLARTLNLTHAVRELGITRQTLRRHISLLEDAKGFPLFVVEDRQYQLTAEGERSLPEAENVLARGNAWLAGKSDIINGLQYLRHVEPDGWCHYQQQKPISYVFSSGGDMLPKVFRAWVLAGGELEHPELKAVRPFCTVSRRTEGNWLFTEVGEKSSFVSWFGWKVARSSVGSTLGDLPAGDAFGRLVNFAYQEIEGTEAARLDHVFTMMPYGEERIMLPIAYERLLLGARFPDKSFAMLSAVRRTYDLEITGVSSDMLRQMPEDKLM